MPVLFPLLKPVPLSKITKYIIVITADVEAVQRLAHKNIPVLLKPFKFSTLLTAIQQSC
jgi:hypothetical protein